MKEGWGDRHCYMHLIITKNPSIWIMISILEKTVKKYADNILCFLEGICSRLSQLELYCYNLEKSVGEMQSDLVRKHSEADSKLKSLEKHLQEDFPLQVMDLYNCTQRSTGMCKSLETNKNLLKRRKK